MFCGQVLVTDGEFTNLHELNVQMGARGDASLWSYDSKHF